MIDDRLMETERRWRATGAPEDEGAWLRERMRRGELDPIWVALAAALEYPGAVAAGVDAESLRESARAHAEALAATGSLRRSVRRMLKRRYAFESRPDPRMESLPAWIRIIGYQTLPVVARAALAVLQPAAGRASATHPRLRWPRVGRLIAALHRYVLEQRNDDVIAILTERTSLPTTTRLPLTEAGDYLVELFGSRQHRAFRTERLSRVTECCARVGDGMPWALEQLRESLVPWALGYRDPLAVPETS